MLLLDILIRYPAVALLLMFAALALRDGRSHPAPVFAAILSISAAALLLGTAPPELQLPLVPYAIVRVLDAASVGLVWWCGLSLFQDNFKLGKFEWTGMAIIFFPVLIFRLQEFGALKHDIPGLPLFVMTISVIMMLHLVYVTLEGREDDVVESRRQFRFYFVIGLVLSTITIVIAERFLYPAYAAELSIFRSSTTLVLAIWGILWLVALRPEKLAFQRVAKVVPSPAIDPRDQVLHETLLSLMESENIYTESGLSIGMLADRLNTSEHRLRALINQGLGYRNFSGFLNRYRIEAVKAAMHVPDNARTPVLTLAMNVGFNSLAPFNRAFRSITGKTPSEYRAEIHFHSD